MGVAGGAVAAILILSVFAGAKAMLGAFASSERASARLQEEHARLLERHVRTQVQFAGHMWEPNCILDCVLIPPTSGNQTLNLTNNGSAVLNASRVTVVLNGTAMPASSIMSRQVNGASTNVWAPAQTLRIRVHVDVGSPYTHRWVATETGASAAQRV